MGSQNLSIPFVASGSASKEIVMNAAVNALDRAGNSVLPVPTAGADVTLTAAQFASAAIFVATGALTAAHNFVVPALNADSSAMERLFVFANGTTGGFAMTVKTPSGTGVSVGGSAGAVLLYSDGTNVNAVAAGGGGGATEFTQLSDVPSSYSGHAGKVATVNLAETGLEFDAAGGGGGGGIGSLVGFRRTAMMWAQDGGGGTHSYGDVINVLGSGFDSFESATASQGPATSYWASSANAAAGWYGNAANNWQFGKNVHMFFETYITVGADSIFRAGLFTTPNDSSLGHTGSLTMPSAHFRYSPADGDTHLQCVTGDGAAEAVADSGVTPVSGHSLACVIAMNDTGGSVAFYMNGALVATSTTHLPPAGACGYQIGEAYASSRSNSLLGISQVALQGDI